MKIFKQSILLVIFWIFPLILFAQADLYVPTIAIYPDTYYPYEEILYLEGRAQPGATVNIVLSKEGEKPLKFNIRADQIGEWALAEKINLSSGSWEIRARVVESDGSVSEWSNPRVVRSVVTGFSLWGALNVKYIAVIAPIVILFLVAIAFLIYSIYRVQKMRKEEHEKEHAEEIKKLEKKLMRKEVEEAKDAVKESIAEVRKELTQDFSPEELKKKEKVLKELYEAEKDIEKKIEDIGE